MVDKVDRELLESFYYIIEIMAGFTRYLFVVSEQCYVLFIQITEGETDILKIKLSHSLLQD